MAISFVAVPLFTHSESARTVARSIAAFALVCAVLIVAYFTLLPDGSFVHASYLTAEPASLARRTLETIDAFGGFFPIMIVPAPFDRLAVAAVAVLAVLGAFRLRSAGFLLAVYSGGHLLLLILFPYKGGQRYYLPVLLAVSVLAMGGCEVLAQWAATKVSRVRALPAAGGALLVSLFVVAIGANLYRFDTQRANHPKGPYSPEAVELFGYIRSQPSDIQPIAFFKPRALRFLAGKDAVAINTLDRTSEVNAIVVCREPTAAELQLSEEQVARLKDFRVMFRNEDFTLYVRNPVATARALPGVRQPK
jgi:hypothetical protein